jgi:hypothetical protein
MDGRSISSQRVIDVSFLLLTAVLDAGNQAKRVRFNEFSSARALAGLESRYSVSWMLKKSLPTKSQHYLGATFFFGQ